MTAGQSEPSFWHQRYTEQARWTRQVRDYLFGLAGLASAERILEVGCGTGAVLQELPRPPVSIGLDIDLPALNQAAEAASLAALCCGDGHALPFASASFDIVYAHFLLLWTAHPGAVIAEMRRVTRPGGWVLALAEPDYGGRIDYPPPLALAGEWQRRSLAAQGADPLLGRTLGALFTAAGLRHVQSGVMGGQWQHPTNDDGGLEWEVLENDLAKLPDAPSPEEVASLRAADLQARRSGERLLFVPTFYAAGVV